MQEVSDFNILRPNLSDSLTNKMYKCLLNNNVMHPSYITRIKIKYDKIKRKLKKNISIKNNKVKKKEIFQSLVSLCINRSSGPRSSAG